MKDRAGFSSESAEMFRRTHASRDPEIDAGAAGRHGRGFPPKKPANIMNDKLKLLAKDLAREFPRSPREMLAGYVIAARAVDKCRSVLAGTGGDYHSGCPVDDIFLKFAEISYDAFRDFVGTGATDDEIAAWIEKNAKPRPRVEVIRWNNDLRGKRLCELPDGLQEYLEDYIPKFVPRNRPVYVFFDVYDLEEQRI